MINADEKIVVKSIVWALKSKVSEGIKLHNIIKDAINAIIREKNSKW